MLRRLAVTCLLACGCVRPALPQNSPDIQKVLDRLEKLEEENRRLAEEIHQLRSELAGRAVGPETAAPDSTPTPAPAPTHDERLDVQESRTAELAQSKVEASQRFPVLLTGMLLFNAFANGKFGAGSEYPTSAALASSPSDSGASVRQTIVGLKVTGPDLPWGGKANGYLNMDFFAGTSAPSNNLLHIRTAMLNLVWKNTTVSFGQEKPLISPRDPWSLAQVGVSPLTVAGNLWLWQPQVRVERRFSLTENTGFRAQGSVYQTSESYPGTLPQQYAGTLEKARPGYEGRLEFFTGSENRRLEFAPGFHLSTTHVMGESVPSRIVSLDWLARPVRLLEFSGEFFEGRNVAGLGAKQGFYIPPAETESVVAVHSQGEWGQISIFPVSRISLHFYAGEQHDRSQQLAPGSVNRNFVYAGNFVYKLAPNVLAAFEASQARTQYLGSLLHTNNHYDLALAYLF